MTENGQSQMTYSEFIKTHSPQLIGSLVPERYWHTLYEKLTNEVYDAGNVFQIICEEYSKDDEAEDETVAGEHGWKVIVYTDDGIVQTEEQNIFLIDHAWTFRARDVRSYLEDVPGLLERMTTLMEVDTAGRSGEEQIEVVMRNMWK